MANKQRDQQEGDLPAELTSPAQRALAGAGITRVAQVAEMTEAEIKQMHGIGPNALEQLRRALAAKGLSFADGKKSKG